MLKLKLFNHYLKLILMIFLGLFLYACQHNQPIETALSPAQINVEIPSNIPQYPQAKLIKLSMGHYGKFIKIFWEINQDQEIVKRDYQNQLKQEKWQILTPFNSGKADVNRNLLIAQKDNVEIKVLINSNNPPQLVLEYRSQGINLAQNNSIISENSPEPKPSVRVTPTPNVTEPITPNPTITPTHNNSNQAQIFEDLKDLPANFQEYINDFNQLGILTENEIKDRKFNPNEPIKKRDFVRWLVETNNKIYGDDPSKQIRLNNQSTEVAFRDILPSDPDFKYIQALAETGIIFSPLTDKNQPDLFNPDQPLTREELILWKVPFDQRQALPKADLKMIETSWGFQDSNKINPQIFNTLYADFQNQKHSNLKRILSFTQLFQPQKPVTRAEAVACLWYFGNENQGLSLKDFLTRNP